MKGLFFAEAGAMGIWVALVGVALGWTIGHAINLGTNIYLKRQAFPAGKTSGRCRGGWSGAAIVFAFIVSLVSGLYPAAGPLASIPYKHCATSKLSFASL